MSSPLKKQNSNLSNLKVSNLFNLSSENGSMTRQNTSLLNNLRLKIENSKKEAPKRSQSVITSTRKDNFGNPIFKGNQKKYKLAFRDQVDKSKNLCSVINIAQNKNPHAMTIRKVGVRNPPKEEKDDCSCFCQVY